LRQDKIDNALTYFHEALRIDSMNQNSMVGLASAYLKGGQPKRSIEYVTKLHNRIDIAYQYYLQATKAYIESGYDDQARQAFEYAKESGSSSAEIREMIGRHPQLAE
jgi:predicted Zn-dependent protease